MKFKVIFVQFFLIFFILPAAAMADLTQSAEPTSITAAVSAPPAQLPLFYRNSVGIEVAMPGRAIPGISYSRYILQDFFLTGFGGLMQGPGGLDILVSINAHKMINEFFYLGIGTGYIFDNGEAAMVGIANPSAGFMAKITPEVTLYAEGTAWFFRAAINNSVDPFSGTALLIFKAGVKYNFSWLDPLPDMKDFIR